MKWVTARSSGGGRSKRCQAQSSLPVNGESLIHFTRPTLTMVRRRGRYGADCRVWTQPASINSQVGSLIGEIDDDRVQDVAAPRRIGDEDDPRSLVVALRPCVIGRSYAPTSTWPAR